MKKMMLAWALLGASLAFGQVSVGIRIGAPPPVRVEVRPRIPGSGFFWVDGYWYPVGGHYRWHSGYWSRPPYEGAVWVGPHHDGQMFYNGYWEGPRGRVEHDHRWDHDRKVRDYDRH